MIDLLKALRNSKTSAKEDELLRQKVNKYNKNDKDVYFYYHYLLLQTCFFVTRWRKTPVRYHQKNL